MSENDIAADDFAQAVRGILARVGFVAPGVGEACVLVVDSSTLATYAAVVERLLDADERQRAAQFHFERDRSAYLLAHALWRMVLGVCLNVEAGAVPLVRMPSGQPQLPGTPLATSLSHSGDWVAIAVGHAVTLGVDIECSPARIALGGLLTTICTPAEAAEMQELPMPAREAALLALWTRKEALLKAFGTGLLESPSTLSAATAGMVAAPLTSAHPPCRVCDLDLPAGVVGAFAAPIAVGLCRLYMSAGAGARIVLAMNASLASP
ncbi:MAG: 4'-phosphopantetheinyl transferase family protein [Rhodanobacter sp.]